MFLTCFSFYQLLYHSPYEHYLSIDCPWEYNLWSQKLSLALTLCKYTEKEEWAGFFNTQPLENLMVRSSEGTSAKHKIPEFLFKEKSWTLHQRCTFQSSRNLPTALPAQQGRFRQHQTQPMWDASSQSQTTLPWDWSSRERSRVEKHLGLLCTSEWVSAAQGREEKGEETTPPGSHYVSTGTSQGSLLSSPLSWEQGSGIEQKGGGDIPQMARVCPFCRLRSCNSSGKCSFDNYLCLFAWQEVPCSCQKSFGLTSLERICEAVSSCVFPANSSAFISVWSGISQQISFYLIKATFRDRCLLFANESTHQDLQVLDTHYFYSSTSTQIVSTNTGIIGYLYFYDSVCKPKFPFISSFRYF